MAKGKQKAKAPVDKEQIVAVTTPVHTRAWLLIRRTCTQANQYLKQHVKHVKHAGVIAWIIVIAVVLGLGSYLLVDHFTSNAADDACSTKAESSLFNQAVTALSNYTKPTQLQQSVSKIQKLPNYQKDPNCMYVVTVYYVNSFDLTKAQSSLDQFNKVYSAKKLSPKLTNFLSVAGLRNSVKAANQKLQQIQHNAALLSPRSPTVKTK